MARTEPSGDVPSEGQPQEPRERAFPVGLLKATLAFALTIMTFGVLIVAKPLLLPLAIAVLFWLIINGMARFLQLNVRIGSHQLPYWAALAGSIAVSVLVSMVVIERIAANLQQMAAAAPRYQENFSRILAQLADTLGLDDTAALTGLIRLPDLQSVILLVVNSAAELISSAGTIALYVAFMLVEQQVFERKVAVLFPDTSRREFIKAFAERVRRSVQKYLSAKTLTSLLTGVCVYAVLTLVGVDFAGFWGFIAFLANFIPIVGSLFSSLLPALLALVQFPTIGPFLIVVVGLTTVQIVIGNLVEPRVLGRSVNLSPFAVVLTLALWGFVWGIPGMVLSVPITVIAMILFAEFDATRPIAVALSDQGRVHGEV